MSFILFITVICLLVPVYVYFGYPAILWLLTRNREPHSPTAADAKEANLPIVTLVISCYNEAAVITEKLSNALALDYPAD